MNIQYFNKKSLYRKKEVSDHKKTQKSNKKKPRRLFWIKVAIQRLDINFNFRYLNIFYWLNRDIFYYQLHPRSLQVPMFHLNSHKLIMETV